MSTLYSRTYHVAVTESLKTFNYTIIGFSVNQTYEVEIAAEGEYQWCSYNEIIGNKSEPVNISTAAKGTFYIVGRMTVTITQQNALYYLFLWY